MYDGPVSKHIYLKVGCHLMLICFDTVKKYLSKRLSPLDARVVALFDTPEGKPSMHNG